MDSQELFKKAEDLRNQEKLDGSIAAYQQAREQAFKEGNLWIAQEALHMIGLLYQQKGDLKKAEEVLVQAQQEFSDGLAMVLRDRARVALEVKDLEKAENLIKQSIDLLVNSSQKGHLGISQVQLAKVLAQKGDLEGAEQIIKDSIKLIAQSDNKFFASSAYFSLGQLQNQAGKKEEARKSVKKSLEILDAITTPDQHQKLKTERKSI